MRTANVLRNFIFAVTAASVSTTSLPVLAQSSGAILEEIVVTARKREESLQDTPLAVTAFGAADLEQRNIGGISEISRYTPNIQFDNVASESGGGGSSQISIRGIGQTDYVLTVEPGVGLYMDGVYIGKSVGSLIDNVDIERVEVLRGPQGTLFGKNTIGGAVSVISKRPSEEFEASVDLTTGSFERLDVKTYISGPVHERLRLSFSGASQNREGHVRRVVVGDRAGNKESLFGRVVAEVDVTDNLLATFRFDMSNANEEAAGQVLIQADENGFFPSFHNAVDFPACATSANNGLLAFFGQGAFASPTVDDPARFSNPNCFNSQYENDLEDRENSGIGPNFSDTTVWGANMTFEWDLGAFDVKSITSYRNTDVNLAQDLAPNGAQYEDIVTQDIVLESVTQELQLSGTALSDRLDYTLGFFWSNETGSQAFGVQFDPVEFVSGGSIDNTSYAFFAQGTYDFTDQLALTLGMRYSKDELRFRPEQVFLEQFGASGQVLSNIFGPTIAPGQDILPRVFVDSHEDNFSPAVTLSYDWNEEVMTYFTYSQGYKAGGFTMRAFPATIPGVTTTITDPDLIIPAFGPEEVENFEIGLKSQLLDNRLRLNLAGFFTNYDDLQILANAGVGGLVPVIFNAGDADLWGFEAEAEFVATDWLRVNGSLGWLDHEYKRVDPNTPLTLDSELVNAPEWNASIGFTADVMNNDHGRAFLRFDWAHKGKQSKSPFNEVTLDQSAYDIVNMSLSWESVDQHWLATAGVTNLTDEIYIVSGTANTGTGITAASPSRPQEWFFKIKYSF